MSDTIRWYPSKVDPWLGVLLAFVPLILIGASTAIIAKGGNPFVALLPPSFVALIYGGLVFPVRYGVAGGELIVQAGLSRTRIALGDILEVEPTRNPLSSPALSLDRLKVRFGEGIFRQVMISPREKGEFLNDLAARAGLRRVGERLLKG